jgi:two-component system nitrogen regulation response regulator GlnG
LVRLLAALYSEEVIGVESIEVELAETTPAVAEPESDGLSGSVERHLRNYFNALGGSLPAPGLFDRILREVERPLIILTLEATRGNQIRAAEVLGVNRNTLRKKIRELSIPVVRGGSRA